MSPLTRTMIAFGLKKKTERELFDAAFYRATYPDIANARVDPFEHFMAHGWREGRNPSRTFHTLYYRDQHLGGVATNPLTHYVAGGGAASGLATLPPSEDEFVRLQRPLVDPLFDFAFYRAQSETTSKDLLGHYLTTGWKQGKAANATFDLDRYFEDNSYVKSLGVSPLYHFASQERMRIARPKAGQAPKVPRSDLIAAIEPAFDRQFYLRRYHDIKLAKVDPFFHYVEYGMLERRLPNAFFDPTFYLASNPDVVRLKLDPFYHYVTIGRGEGRRGTQIGTRLYPPLLAPDAWTDAVPAADTDAADIIVIMPVYKGYDESLASIHAVLTAPQKTPFALHVINDASPDGALAAILADLAAQGLFSYSRNETNVGFVKTCNRGLRQFADKAVVLLNADTAVHGDWLDRMDAHAKRDPTIATITPLSNNATICSYPECNDNNIVEPERSAAAMDSLAARCNAGRVSDIPTGVGFCFYMNKASRDAIGILDEVAFGRGYGEENDFCLRATKAGFRNVLAEDIFVYHAGEVSFAELAASEYGPGQKALLGKHPEYPVAIRQHLEADPALYGRMRLDLRRLAEDAGPGCMIFVSHALKGGIHTHIERMEKRLAADGVTVVHLRVGASNAWGVEIVSASATAPFCPNLRPIAFNNLRPLLVEFLDWLAPRAIHFHSLVGFDWQAANGLMDLVRQSAIPYYFTVHDYSVVCHRNDLVKPNGRYCGLPGIEVCRACLRSDRSYPEAIDPGVRRETYAAFLAGATAVFAPSSDIAERLRTAGVPYAIEVRPHEESYAIEPVPRPADDADVIDIVSFGAIGPHKGSRVILSLARDAKARKLPLRFHIIGYSDSTTEMEDAGVEESGRYDSDAEAIDAARAIRPAYVLLPSIWPETFCYTLSMAFMIEVAPIVFDLGAQRDRVEAAGFGVVLPYRLIDHVRDLNDLLVALPAAGAPPPSQAPRRKAYEDILRDYYGATPGAHAERSVLSTPAET